LKNETYRFPLALTLVDGIGSIKAKNLISYLGSPEAVFTERKAALLKVPGIGERTFSKKGLTAALEKADRTIETLNKTDHSIYYYLEDNYPRRLKQIEDNPILLFGKGNFDSNPKRSIAVVGTRNATPYGKQLCHDLVLSLKNSDVTIVSGLAHGIDGITHHYCVKEQIPTIGVLGHGLDRIYPAIHKGLAQKMLENGGLLTEFIPGTIPESQNFPMRNRIVAGMVDAVIVVESDIKGGSLITCELANDYNKDVFAFPGPIYAQYSRGCNRMIAESKAHLLTSTEHFLRFMNWDAKKETTQLNFLNELDDEQRSIVQLLKEKGQTSIDVLSFISQIPQGKLSSILLTMEFAGFLRSLPGKMYQLSERILQPC
jgi:DNA processing protein